MVDGTEYREDVFTIGRRDYKKIWRLACFTALVYSGWFLAPDDLAHIHDVARKLQYQFRVTSSRPNGLQRSRDNATVGIMIIDDLEDLQRVLLRIPSIQGGMATHFLTLSLALALL